MIESTRDFDKRMHNILVQIKDERFVTQGADQHAMQCLKEALDRNYIAGDIQLAPNVKGDIIGRASNIRLTKEGLAFLERRKINFKKYALDNLIAFLAFLVAIAALIVSIISISQTDRTNLTYSNNYYAPHLEHYESPP
ncbi:MAG: hypothetical protein FWC75_06305 [Oscillospiraceae bacterium]|nr:hypothetical protein [Oscillospiraceae bacterium]